jgi:hypothetical protein
LALAVALVTTAPACTCREQTFTYLDCYHTFAPTSNERNLDATGFLERLSDRSRDGGLFSKFSTDSEGLLENLFFVLAGASSLYSIGASYQGNIVPFDTKVRLHYIIHVRLMLQFHLHWDLTVFIAKTICFIQHGTNRYRLKLGLFTTVDSNGATRILAACLVTCETAESVAWAFDCFMDFRILPLIILTDSDPVMAAAIKLYFPSTLHFLCTYHLSKNLLKHVRPIFGGDKTAWHKFNSSWWRIRLKTDSSCTVQFHEDWESLLSICPRTKTYKPNVFKEYWRG